VGHPADRERSPPELQYLVIAVCPVSGPEVFATSSKLIQAIRIWFPTFSAHPIVCKNPGSSVVLRSLHVLFLVVFFEMSSDIVHVVSGDS
jgi:hypothetical protein